VAYPHNVTFWNFFYFLCAPTLVYELNYPRTERVRFVRVHQPFSWLLRNGNK
jgi:hypothetical protein